MSSESEEEMEAEQVKNKAEASGRKKRKEESESESEDEKVKKNEEKTESESEKTQEEGESNSPSSNDIQEDDTSERLKICCIGDPHFMVDNAAVMKQFIEIMIEWIEKNDPDIIVCLGDILHQHERIHITPFMLALKFLEECRKRKPTYLLIGNHDRPNNSHDRTEEHPFVACKEWENLTIVDRGHVAEIKGFHLVFVPYVPPGRFRAAYDDILSEFNLNKKESENNGRVDLVFAHQEFKGCKMGIVRSENGDAWSHDDPKCISGHIHLRQELKRANVYYVGTPLQHDHSEVEDKGIHMVTLDKVEDNEVMIKIRFDMLPLPRKITLSIRADEFDTIKVPRGQIKLIVRGEPSEIKAIKRSPRYKKLLKKCKIHFLPTIIANTTPIDPNLSFLDLVQKDLKKEERKYLRALIDETLEEIT